jgi:hypothetical protein
LGTLLSAAFVFILFVDDVDSLIDEADDHHDRRGKQEQESDDGFGTFAEVRRGVILHRSDNGVDDLVTGTFLLIDLSGNDEVGRGLCCSDVDGKQKENGDSDADSEDAADEEDLVEAFLVGALITADSQVQGALLDNDHADVDDKEDVDGLHAVEDIMHRVHLVHPVCSCTVARPLKVGTGVHLVLVAPELVLVVTRKVSNEVHEHLVTQKAGLFLMLFENGALVRAFVAGDQIKISRLPELLSVYRDFFAAV